MTNKQSKGVNQERVIRVFISSTFLDMKEERDELVKRIFPQLRRLCESRGVTWGEVDLRWGITDEQKAEGKVLPICLDEIHRCRPYFIGLLGERYGWLPKSIPTDLIKKESWLEEHKEKSVTELEILHGVLNNPDMVGHAFFYFRDPEYPATQDEEEEDKKKKLIELKNTIRKRNLPVRENYANPEALGKLVLADLINILNEKFPEGSQLDSLDREALDHETLAQNKSRIYIGRQEYFEKLDEHVKGNFEPLVLLGESGMGKTALLANWALNYRKKNPDDFMIMHFIGGTQQSTDWTLMLRRIMGEFKRRFDFQQDIPTELDQLKSVFTNWLHMAAARGRVILLIDALNQLEDKDNAHDLVWLPPEIPENIRLILSTLPGKPLDDILKRKWSTLEINQLNDNECNQLIHAYLAQYGKSLDNKRVIRILNAEQTRNPLFLRSFLDELRIFGDHDELDDRICYYVEAKNIPSLFDKILERFEQDYERDRPNLVRDSMSLISASRRGISEVEILDILGNGADSLPQAIWAPLYLAADRYLVNRSGLIGFSHDYMKQAVIERYISDEEDKKTIHKQIAEYFENKELNPRKVDELPWQLSKVKEWHRLNDLLFDQLFFKEAWEKDQFEVMTYWAEIEGSSNLKLVDCYQSVVKNPDSISQYEIILYISRLLSFTGHRSEAQLLLEYLSELYQKNDDHINLATTFIETGSIFISMGKLDDATEILKKAELLCHKLGDKRGLSKSIGQLGIVYFDQGDFENSMKYFKKQENICREINDKLQLSHCISNQGLIFREQGNHKSALTLFKESELLKREIGDKGKLTSVLSNQGIVYMIKGDLDQAMRFLNESEQLSREIGHKNDLNHALSAQGYVLMKRGDYNGAMTLYREMEQICEEMGSKPGLAETYNHQGLILKLGNDLEGAKKLYKKSEQLCRELGYTFPLSSVLINIGEILLEQGDMDGAMELFVESERMKRQLDDKWGLSLCLINQGIILDKLGKLSNAFELLKQSERVAREGEVLEVIIQSLIKQADLLNRLNETKQALSLAEQAFNEAKEHGFENEIKECKAVLDKIKEKMK